MSPCGSAAASATLMYRHPASYRPPLALGGHAWTFTDAERFDWFTCLGCFVTIPRWVLTEGFWRNLAGSYCLGALRALPRARCPFHDPGTRVDPGKAIVCICRSRTFPRAGLCPIQGDAVVQDDPTGQRWLQADPEIHINEELVNIEAAWRFIEARYSIDERCPYNPRTRHARLRPALDWAEHEPG